MAPQQGKMAFSSCLAILALMLGAPLLSLFLTPAPIAREAQPDLEALVPARFGNWSIDPEVVPLPPTSNQDLVERTYDQIVTRTYVNDRAERMMLVIAYGSRQDQKLKAHRQEVCYAAQGFQIHDFQQGDVLVGGNTIPITRMVATSGPRVESVTYWFTVGNQVVQSRGHRLLAQLKYGLTGTIPDGVLVRVSSLGPSHPETFASQQAFVNDLVTSMPANARQRIVGAPTG